MDLFPDFFSALQKLKVRALNFEIRVPPQPSARSISPPTANLAVATSSAQLVGSEGIRLIKEFEHCARLNEDGNFEAYPDPGSGGDPWTIGWGATGKGIVRGTVWTQAECDARLERDLVRFAREVARTLGAAPTTQTQFDALVSFHYNTGAIAKATLTRLHCAGRHAEAAEEFGRWVNAGGKRLPGLVRRRAAEASLYSTG